MVKYYLKTFPLLLNLIFLCRVYWFNNSIKYNGGDEVASFACPFSEFPLFVLSGSILPLQVDNHYTNLGTKHSTGYITVLISQPLPGRHTTAVHEFQSNGYIVEYDYNESNNELEVFISAHTNNRFIILVSNVNGNNCEVGKARTTNNAVFEFEKLEHFNDEDAFWEINQSASMYRKVRRDFNQLFVRVSEIAIDGVYLKIKNIQVYN